MGEEREGLNHDRVDAVGEGKWWNQERHEGADFSDLLSSPDAAERKKVALPAAQVAMYLVCTQMHVQCLAFMIDKAYVVAALLSWTFCP